MNRKLTGILLLCLCLLGFASCLDDQNDEEIQVTNYQEYTLTVASKKLIGRTLLETGDDVLTDVYAVKKENEQQWSQFPTVRGLEYERGYEYRISISETHYLDPRRCPSEWTEYKLLEILSKEKKESDGLPSNFLTEQGYVPYPISVAYAIDAEQKEAIEDDLNNQPRLFRGSFFFNKNVTNWALFDENMGALAHGSLEKKLIEEAEVPTVFGLLPPEGQVVATMWWVFNYIGRTYNTEHLYYAYLTQTAASAGTRENASSHFNRIWLYEDWTNYYEAKYPEAHVKAVVVRYSLK